MQLPSFVSSLPPRAAALLLAVCLPPAAAQPPAPGPRPIACLIVPDRVADVGSPSIGVVREIVVDRGDTVKKGDLIARLHAEVEQAGAGIARSRADARAELGAAEAARDLAAERLERTRELHGQGFVSTVALDQSRAEWNVARARAEQVREQLGTAGREVALAGAQLAQRRIVAPFDGVVVERYRNPGERVEDKPLVRIAAVDPLRVELVLPSEMYGRVREGDIATVQPELPGMPARAARVARVDRVLDAASGTFRARLTIDNADGRLPAGLRCKAGFADGDSAAAAARPDTAAATLAASADRAPRVR